MKRNLLFGLVCGLLVSISAGAQMPDVDALKKNANDAVSSGQQEAQKAASESAKSSSSLMETAKKKALVNLNTASAEDLAKVPGIGTQHAQAIIQGRPYSSLSDLKKIPGLKESAIEKLKSYVTVK